MTQIEFGRLMDLPPRDAWPHEAHAFTPWLAENIDHLSDVIGVPLELTGQEVAVDDFAADILARNTQDDTAVLIENQLERTDHVHLGQIMTYLAGLEAQTVIWIAPSFREPHLSAIRWLNQHTVDGFSFFAIKLRVVQIGSSPFAPILEVVEKPNDWDRQVERKVRSLPSPDRERRIAFWQFATDRHPDLAGMGFLVNAHTVQWLEAPLAGVIIGVSVGKDQTRVYLRGRDEVPAEQTRAVLAPHAARLGQELDAEFAADPGKNCFVETREKLPFGEEDTWPQLTDAIAATVRKYHHALRALAETEGT